MTQEQLIKNIAKSNYKSSNYINRVKRTAYDEVIRYNNFVSYTNENIKDLKEKEVIEVGKYRIYNKKGKLIYFTKYTKYLKYRTYRQQLAITYRQLEKELDKRLKDKDLRFQIFKVDLRLQQERKESARFMHDLFAALEGGE